MRIIHPSDDFSAGFDVNGDVVSSEIHTPTNQGESMNKLMIVLLASVFATGVANAADGAKDETRTVAPKTTRTTTGSTPINAAAPQLAGLSQQNKMICCSAFKSST